MIPVTGWAAKRFGAKRVWITSLILFTAGSALCGLATTTNELIAFRVLQGIGGGMILPIGQLMMADAAGPERMGRVMSIVAVPAMLAPILGPAIGGLILDNASWQWIFYVNLPIGIVAVITSLRTLPRDKPTAASAPAGRLDVRGLALMATGLPLLIYGLAEVGTTGAFGFTKVILPCLVGLSLIGFFILHALRVPKPLLNVRLYKRPTFASASFAMFCLGAALFGGLILLPLYWQNIRHEDVLRTGLLTAPQGLGMALVMPLAGKLTDRFGGGPLALIGVIVTTLATVPFGLISAHSSILGLSIAMFIRGNGDRLCLHAGDGGRVRVAEALRAPRRHAAAQRAPARRRLDRHRRAGGCAPAGAGRHPHSLGRGGGVRHGLLGGGRTDRAGDHPVHHPCARRAGRARRQGAAGGALAGGAWRGGGGVTVAPERSLEAAAHMGRSFKGAIAAMRRMRGRETQCPGELSDAQYGLLFGLQGHDSLSARELAFQAGVSPASATEMLEGLEAAGLVSRVRSEVDRRVVLTSLTERGRELVDARQAHYEPRWHAAFASFSDEELLGAAAVLDRVATFFDELAEERQA